MGSVPSGVMVTSTGEMSSSVRPSRMVRVRLAVAVSMTAILSSSKSATQSLTPVSSTADASDSPITPRSAPSKP
jgi:hypothetical protein